MGLARRDPPRHSFFDELAKVQLPFETVFQFISGRLPERERKKKELIDERKNVQTNPNPHLSQAQQALAILLSKLVGRPSTESLPITIAPADHLRFRQKYAGWRAREKERLDRRYKGVYKTYLREFSDLGIDEETLNKARKKHAASKESSVAQKDADEGTEADTIKVDAEDETDAHADLLDFSRLKLNQKRRSSVATTSAQYVPAADDMVRRRSTGNALPLEVLENLRRSSLPLLHKDTPLRDGDIAKAASSSSVTETSEQATNATDEITPHDSESHDKGRRGRRASLAVTSDLAGSKELQNIVNPGRRGRRASLAVTSDISNSGEIQPLNLPGRRGRRGSVTLTQETGSFQTTQRARLSRRSSIPNIEIPIMYGN